MIPPTEDGLKATTADMKDILTGFIQEVWNEGNAAACDRYIGRLYTIHHDPGDPWNSQTLSLDGYKERLVQSRAPFPDQRFEIVDLLQDGSRVAMTWRWQGTHSQDFPGFPATGREIRMSGATVYYFDGDRITGHWQVADRLGVFQQLRAE